MVRTNGSTNEPCTRRSARRDEPPLAASGKLPSASVVLGDPIMQPTRNTLSENIRAQIWFIESHIPPK
jgi:hypothetical protein